jgi:ubiquinol-cytochrome c reductase cytochrome c1 subunit
MTVKAALLTLVLAFNVPALAQHPGDGALRLEPASTDVGDLASLRRGATYFVNYCLGCHSAQYVRYSRLAEDLELTESQLAEIVMSTGVGLLDMMNNAMTDEHAAAWFGVAPPDLSLIARSRGTDYLYNFLRGFYQDASAPSGANNLWLQNTAMPHVLWELQGVRRAVFVDTQVNGVVVPSFEHFEPVTPGTLSEAEYDGLVRDIVTFLDYIGEPMQLERRALGVRVIGFLLVFLLIAYMLKREIWKDVD